MTDTRRPGVCGSDYFSIFFIALAFCVLIRKSLGSTVFVFFCFSLKLAKYYSL